ncbi:23S rRNA (guanosine(2251)-2'-O)-methyltransferase RlmB [Dongia deserti]|uniref:23S rRNA (guanosine(2251)-2'-O)-methyltransferase RlmB n=1 Tax=Dongia deserti TaxID=2268030 RepID=UPI000E64D23A|nr:23S rRNA (guanosine(2251)-2'-O)-methyltransferase RlmB [Dongia deserti]
MNKRKPPSRGRERGSGRPHDFSQDQRHRPHRHDAGRRPDRGAAAASRGHRDEPWREHSQPGGPYWLYGHHAVTVALANPERKILRLAQAGAGDVPTVEGHDWEHVPRDVLESWLPPGAVHQGLAAKVHPLPDRAIEDVIAEAEGLESAQVMILDQVTDPQNVGAILRSAAAFGALAVILTERHAAPESGALAKAASGALEHVPLIRVASLARALELLKKKGGFWIAGLAAEAPQTLAEAKLTGKVGLALGAEGPGLRRLTREHCDLLVRLPTGGPIDHLNVSNAAAVALYELVRGQGA